MSKQKICFISGAARGIGAATSRVLARNGWRVVIGYLKSENIANSLVCDIIQAGGCAESINADVTDLDAMHHTCNIFCARGIQLDVVIHNAVAPFQRAATSRLGWESAFSVQLHTSCAGFLHTLQALRPVMKPDCLVVAILTSALTVDDGANTAAYLAGKGALLGLCKGWYRELSTNGGKLILVSPSATKTDLLLHSGGVHPRQVELLSKTLDESGIALPDEIAAQLLKIISKAPVLTSGEQEPLHLIVGKKSIHQLQWVLNDINL